MVRDEQLSILYHALRAARRRRVIQLLNEGQAPRLSTRDLAKAIATEEQGLVDGVATGEPYRNVYNALSQTHLPTLSDAGILIYDPQRQTVTYGPNFDIAALLIDINTLTVELFSATDSDVFTDNSESTENG
jgi:DNA-binding transcriptional ArsR family regulator